MKIILAVTGVLAALALLAPNLVVLGFIFGIVPGVILAVSPTLFVYVAATVLIRLALPMSPGFLRNLAAFLIALAAGGACLLPFRMREMAKYDAAVEPQVAAAQPIQLRGHVRLEVSEIPSARPVPIECDHLCAGLLDEPGVGQVTRVLRGQAVTYTLRTAAGHPAPGEFPKEPGRILYRQRDRLAFREMQGAAQALEAQWALRLATTERLVGEPAARDAAADWIVRGTRNRKSGEPAVYRIKIYDRNGVCHFRTSYVRYRVPAYLFYLGFHGGSSADGFAGARFEIGRQTVESGSAVLESDFESALTEAIRMEIRQPSDGAFGNLRAAVAAALKDPEASDARLALANRWMSLFRSNATAEDTELIAGILADTRIHDVAEPFAQVFRRDETPVTLREALAMRILMEHTSEKDRYALAERLAALPAGAFAHPAPAHLRIWMDAEMRRQAAPFVARLADLGGDKATPILLRALEEAVPLDPWNRKQTLINGIREAFIELGPEASQAIPRIRELFLRRPSPIMHTVGDADSWRFALARMGVLLDDLPFFPNQKEPEISRMKNGVRALLESYQPRAGAIDPAAP